MQTTFQNKGITKTIINNNGKKDENEIKWTANYDGEKTNINLDFSKNCKKNKLRLELNNTDLADILGVKPVPISLEKRLKSSFLDSESSDSDSDKEDYETPIQSINSNNLSDNIDKLLNIRTMTPITRESSYKPEPYLFRVNIPKNKSKIKNSLSESTPEILKVSEMLFDPAFDLSAPPIQLREPTYIDLPNSIPTLTPESLLPITMLNDIKPFKISKKQSLKAISPYKISKNKLKTKRKSGKKGNLIYKTPSPKTYRIHLTNKGKGKSKSKKHRSNMGLSNLL